MSVAQLFARTVLSPSQLPPVPPAARGRAPYYTTVHVQSRRRMPAAVAAAATQAAATFAAAHPGVIATLPSGVVYPPPEHLAFHSRRTIQTDARRPTAAAKALATGSLACFGAGAGRAHR